MSCADGYTLHDTGTVYFEWWDWVRIMLASAQHFSFFAEELRLHRGCTTLTTTNAMIRTRRNLMETRAVSTTRKFRPKRCLEAVTS